MGCRSAFGARGGTRTHTSLRTLAPEASESTNSTTRAYSVCALSARDMIAHCRRVVNSFFADLRNLTSHIDNPREIRYNKPSRQEDQGGKTNEAYPDSGDPQPLRERQDRRLRRVPDFLPVRLQDQLRHCQSEVREDREVRKAS